MNPIIRHVIPIVTLGTLAFVFASQTATAAGVSGAISFNGSVTPFVNATGTGTTATDFSEAHSLKFSGTMVSSGANGSFSGIAQGTSVDMFSPLVINPIGLPMPIGTALWTVDGFTFTPTSLTEDTLVSPFNTLTLRGTGILSDGTPADTTTGIWVASFTEASSSGGESFSFSSASQANAASAADSGSTFALLGVGFLTIGAFGYARKKPLMN